MLDQVFYHEANKLGPELHEHSVRYAYKLVRRALASLSMVQDYLITR